MQKRFLFCSFLLVVLPATTLAQQPPPNLAGFFEQRLGSMPQPSYEELLRVIDPIGNMDSNEVSAALPFLFSALKSSKENLPVEAAFALYQVAQRPDGGTLLRTRIPEIAGLLGRPDERLSGGAVLTLRFLTPSASDLTIPILIEYLNGPAKPNFIKAEIVSTLTKFRPNDPVAMKAIDTFVAVPAETSVRVATLQALSVNHVNTPGVDDFAIHSLDDPNRYVKIG